MMLQLATIGSYEAKTHLSDVLRRVRSGQGFVITQRGEPIADLLPTGSSTRRAGVQAAVAMQRFMAEIPLCENGKGVDIPSLIREGRD